MLTVCEVLLTDPLGLNSYYDVSFNETGSMSGSGPPSKSA